MIFPPAPGPAPAAAGASASPSPEGSPLPAAAAAALPPSRRLAASPPAPPLLVLVPDQETGVKVWKASPSSDGAAIENSDKFLEIDPTSGVIAGLMKLPECCVLSTLTMACTAKTVGEGGRPSVHTSLLHTNFIPFTRSTHTPASSAAFRLQP